VISQLIIIKQYPETVSYVDYQIRNRTNRRPDPSFILLRTWTIKSEIAQIAGLTQLLVPN